MRYSQKYIDEMKREIPHIAFRMFAEHGIEAVSMQNLADECKLGIATLYRYYGTKFNLVVQICAEQWSLIAKEVEKDYQERKGECFNALEEVEYFLDYHIRLFQTNKALLKFNSNFDLYVLHEQPSREDMAPYFEAVQFFQEKFHRGYSKAFTDHTIRTDISEEEVYFGMLYAMRSAAAKYAYGTIYPNDIQMDYLHALQMQKAAFVEFMTQQ